MTLLAGVGIYCFFAFRYPYHIHFQEQCQLFESTWAYFASVAAVPGGFADWLGRFLTQFFYYAPAGALIMTLLLCGVQLLTWAVCKEKSLPAYALSFFPAALLLLFYCDENALLGGGVAIALSLAAAALCQLIRRDRARLVLEAVAVPVLYFLCGPVSLVFALAVIITETGGTGAKAIPFSLLILALLAVCPLIASRLAPYPLSKLYTGIHYYRYRNMIPALLWLSALSTVIPAVVSLFPAKGKNILPGAIAYVFVAAAGIFLLFRTADAPKEEWMRYDFMVRMQMWNRIMMAADSRNPDGPKTVSCLNLALAKTGRMPDAQFSYYQNGPEGLLPGFRGDYTNPVSTGEIFWHLGMVNTAQRFAFEAQEAIPDFQKSARCYRRLAETNIVNGDTDVARKYLKALCNATFYRRWARETISLLDDGTIFEKRPELARARDCRLREHDFLFSDTEMDSMLGLLKVENSSNSMALDYLMSWCLLRKDLDRFVECIPLVDAPAMPKSYQEALLLRWVLTHNDFNGLPSYISLANVRRMNEFIADLQAKKGADAMQKAYGDTYWFYYYFRYLSKNDLSRDEKNPSGPDGGPYSGGL